jgi:hypothetical protein
VAVDDHSNPSGIGLEVQVRNGVQHVDEAAIEFDRLSGRKLRGGTVGVDVSADGSDRRDLSQRVKDPNVTDITCVQDVCCPAQSVESFGSQQAVSVGDDADHRARA